MVMVECSLNHLIILYSKGEQQKSSKMTEISFQTRRWEKKEFLRRRKSRIVICSSVAVFLLGGIIGLVIILQGKYCFCIFLPTHYFRIF